MNKYVYLLIFAAMFIVGGAAGINVPLILGMALMGMAATQLLRTGSFEPILPGLSRAEAPVTFWVFTVMIFVALAGFALSIALHLILNL